MRYASPSPAIFDVIFDEYDLSIILNLFDNNDPYAVNTHKWKMWGQNTLYLAKDSELGVKKLKKLYLENCSKSTKTAITVSKFKKIFRGSMTLDSLDSYFCFSTYF